MRGAVWLFWSGRTLFELYHFAYAMLHPEEYPNGRHRDGYDCYGVDSQGLDISGMPAYDELGDCINYARDDSGRDRFGFDLQGRDRTGKRLPLLEPVSDTCEMVYLKKEQ